MVAEFRLCSLETHSATTSLPSSRQTLPFTLEVSSASVRIAGVESNVIDTARWRLYTADALSAIFIDISGLVLEVAWRLRQVGGAGKNREKARLEFKSRRVSLQTGVNRLQSTGRRYCAAT